MLQGFGGVFVGLLGEFVGGEVVAFVVRCGGCLVGVSGFVVEFGGSFVWTLRHGGSPWCAGRLAAHPAAVYGEDGSCDVVACGGA